MGDGQEGGVSVLFSRAAAKSWADIHWAIDARFIDPSPLVWGCPNNPFVIEVNLRRSRPQRSERGVSGKEAPLPA
jgi:hypothetical protein